MREQRLSKAKELSESITNKSIDAGLTNSTIEKDVNKIQRRNKQMKILKDNQFVYKLSDGAIKGFFNIYQAKSGKIILNMGNNATALSKEQIQELHIDCYSLIDFDHESYMKSYFPEQLN